MNVIHRLLHGHWPRWEMTDYDFMTWNWKCANCKRSSKDPKVGVCCGSCGRKVRVRTSAVNAKGLLVCDYCWRNIKALSKAMKTAK